MRLHSGSNEEVTTAIKSNLWSIRHIYIVNLPLEGIKSQGYIRLNTRAMNLNSNGQMQSKFKNRQKKITHNQTHAFHTAMMYLVLTINV